MSALKAQCYGQAGILAKIEIFWAAVFHSGPFLAASYA
jgi:hypothetical protein